MLESLHSDLSGKTRPLLAFMFISYFFMLSILLIDLANPLLNPTINRITVVAVPFDVVFTTSTAVDRAVLFALSGSLFSLFVKKRYLNAAPAAASVLIAAAGTIYSESSSIAFFLASMPIAGAAAYMASRHPAGAAFSLDRRYMIDSIVKFAIAFEAFALVRWVLYPIFPSPVYGNESWRLSDIEAKIFYLIGYASPVLLIAISFSYVVRYSLGELGSAAKKFLSSINFLAGQTHLPASLPVSPRTLLVAALVASVLLPLYPYLPTVNPKSIPVSVDVSYYGPWMDRVLGSRNTQEFLENVFVNVSGGDRPLALLLFYAVKVMTGLPMLQVLKFMPVILTPALTLVTYHFLKTGSKNAHLASVVAIMVPVSTTVMVGIFAGFYSNWLALIIAIAGLAFLLKYLESGRIMHALALLGCIVAVLFSHNYTWSYFVSALVLFAAVYAVMHKRERKALVSMAVLGMLIAVSAGVDLAKMAFLKNDSGLDKELTAASNQVGTDQFAARWTNLWYVFAVFLGGFYTNAVFYALALLWALRADYKNAMNLAIMVMLFVGSLALLAGEYSVQARVIWDMPIFMPAGIVMYSLLRNGNQRSILVFIAILLHFGNYMLRSLSNLQFPT